MDKFDYAILHTLMKHSCFTKISSMTIKEMNLDMQQNTIYKRATSLKAKGYIINGFKDSRSDTYYISETGLEILKGELG